MDRDQCQTSKDGDLGASDQLRSCDVGGQEHLRIKIHIGDKATVSLIAIDLHPSTKVQELRDLLSARQQPLPQYFCSRGLVDLSADVTVSEAGLCHDDYLVTSGIHVISVLDRKYSCGVNMLKRYAIRETSKLKKVKAQLSPETEGLVYQNSTLNMEAKICDLGLPQYVTLERIILRKFKCDQCSHSSYRLCDLKKHEKSHLAEKPFHCEPCGTGFIRSDTYMVRSSSSLIYKTSEKVQGANVG
ncbi:hypothetical protein B0J14DRAFT_659996 [Halenospora varia]|nr:hypothetical protein B0J14DRAFT_659996 [Halenospora varia]